MSRLDGLDGLGSALMGTMPEEKQDKLMTSILSMKMCEPFFDFRSAYEASVETMMHMGYTKERAVNLMAKITEDMEAKFVSLPTMRGR